jgi:tyrosyl-DNA phosphodiesterase 2
MVGTTPIPDLTFQKELKVKKQVELTTLPVLPSDHFGLLLKMRHKSK